MSQIYKIMLKPIGSFYFGGEGSFSSISLESIKNKEKKAIDYFKPRQGYFAKSEMFPQQTQLLGMLRKELLLQNKKLLYFKNFLVVPNAYKGDASSIVGDTRWSHNSTLDLGAIESLSPLYIEHKESLFVPAPKDLGLRLVVGGTGYVNGRSKGSFALQKCDGNYFNAKDHMCSDYIDKFNHQKSLDELFTSHIRTHTQTLKYSDVLNDKNEDEEKLFKVMRYTLAQASCFVCYLQMSSDAYLEDGYTTVSLGGEESYFEMRAQKVDAYPDIASIYIAKKTDRSRIVLVSDTYIEDADRFFDLVQVMFASKKTLRTVEYIHRDKNSKQRRIFSKSQKVVMLEKGSVIYFNEENRSSIKEIIESQVNYGKTGYNQYIIIEGEKR